MSSIQTSSASNLSLIQSLIANNRSQYNTIIQKISSGSNYLERSDDSSETNKAAIVTLDQDKNTQYGSNVSTAKNWETSTYSYIDDLADQFSTAVNLSTEANNSINEVSGWSNIAAELSSVSDSMLADANSKYLGTSLFAGTGTNTDTDPFKLVQATDSSGNTISGFYEVSYSGNDASRSIKTSDTTSTDYGTTGADLFDNVSYSYSDTDSSGKTITYSSDGNFNSLEAVSDLKSYLECQGTLSDSQLKYLQGKYGMYENGDTSKKDSPDADAIFTRIMGVISSGSTQVSNCLSSNSSSSVRLNNLETTIKTTTNTDETSYTDIMQLDTAKAATDYSNIQTILTASLSLAGNLSKVSLINYI